MKRYKFQLGEFLEAAFPMGKVSATMFLLFALSALGVLFIPRQPEATLDFWVYARSHAKAYLEPVKRFEAAHPGVTVNFQHVSSRAITQRLHAAFLSGKGAPDVTEVNVDAMGVFFQGPLQDIGFLDVTERIKAEGLEAKLVKARLASVTYKGRIFGIPNDLHPNILVYRKDKFDQMGFDLTQVETWDDFIKIGKQVTKDLDGDGVIDQYALALSRSSYRDLLKMVAQTGNWNFNPAGELLIDNPQTAAVVTNYIKMVGGPEAIAIPVPAGPAAAKAILNGFVLSFLLSDWMVFYQKKSIPQLSGKLSAIPLPALTSGGRRVSTEKGSCISICRASKRPDLAWELCKAIYFDRQNIESITQATGVLPAYKPAWEYPIFHQPDPFYQDLKLSELFLSLAPDMPAPVMHPYDMMASLKLGEVLIEGIKYYESANDRNNLKQVVQKALQVKADELRKEMARNQFLKVQ